MRLTCIGAAVAARLAKDGLAVVINYSGDVKSAEALSRQDRRRAAAGRWRSRPMSAIPRRYGRCSKRTERAFGGVDVLINNAGIMKLAKIADSDDALFDQQVAINLKGSFNAMREAARRLRDGGRIVNFSTSVVGTKQRRRRLHCDQGGDRDHDGDPFQGNAWPQHHGQRRGAGPGQPPPPPSPANRPALDRTAGER